MAMLVMQVMARLVAIIVQMDVIVIMAQRRPQTCTCASASKYWDPWVSGSKTLRCWMQAFAILESKLLLHNDDSDGDGDSDSDCGVGGDDDIRITVLTILRPIPMMCHYQ